MGLRYFLCVLLLLPVFAASAQTLTGTVTDAKTGEPLSMVTVVNIVTQQSAYTNSEGRYSLPATSGQPIAFSYVGYKTLQRAAPFIAGTATMQVSLQPLSYELDEVVIRGLTEYQKDSVWRRETYSRVLARQKANSVFSPVSFLADRISRKSKRTFEFQKSFQYWEKQHFIDSRYTPELAARLTGLQGDSLAHFMNANPMPVEYARTATELELKMWIRDHYKKWMQQPALSDSVQTKQ